MTMRMAQSRVEYHELRNMMEGRNRAAMVSTVASQRRSSLGPCSPLVCVGFVQVLLNYPQVWMCEWTVCPGCIPASRPMTSGIDSITSSPATLIRIMLWSSDDKWINIMEGEKWWADETGKWFSFMNKHKLQSRLGQGISWSRMFLIFQHQTKGIQ